MFFFLLSVLFLASVLGAILYRKDIYKFSVLMFAKMKFSRLKKFLKKQKIGVDLKLLKYKELKPHLMNGIRSGRKTFRTDENFDNFIAAAKETIAQKAQNFDGIESRNVLNFVESCLQKIGREAKLRKNIIAFEHSFSRLVNSEPNGFGLFNVKKMSAAQKLNLQTVGSGMETLAMIRYFEDKEPEHLKLNEEHELYVIENNLRAALLSVKILVFLSEE